MLSGFSITTIADFADLSARAYSNGRTLLESNNGLPFGWKYVTPGEMGMTQIGISPLGKLIFEFNGRQIEVNAEGFFVADQNAAFIAKNVSTGQLTVVFRGTDNLFLDTPASFNNIRTDNLNRELNSFDAVLFAAVEHISNSGSLAFGFSLFTTGHSLGGALAAELLNYSGAFAQAIGFGAPGMTVGAGNTFLNIRHQNDIVGDLFDSRSGTNDLILWDTRYSPDSNLAAHNIFRYAEEVNRIERSDAFAGLTAAELFLVYVTNETVSYSGSVPEVKVE